MTDEQGNKQGTDAGGKTNSEGEFAMKSNAVTRKGISFSRGQKLTKKEVQEHELENLVEKQG